MIKKIKKLNIKSLGTIVGILLTAAVVFSSFGGDITSIFNKKQGKNMEDERFYKIDKNEIVSGCVGGMDCIPSIDDPKFESSQEASSWLDDEDIVLGINYNGVQKAFPKRILNWHEIVNDEFDGVPVAVTFCPLCGTGVSFVRQVNGKTVEFGVSGKLHNSDLIMYDRTEEQNYWQQVTGEAIVGPAAKRNESLQWIATTTTDWGRWKEKYPESLVLSKDTGYNRNYDAYPYGDYEESNRLLFEVDGADDRFHRKAIVYGIRLNENTSKAYLLEDLKEAIAPGETFTDNVNSVEVEIFRSEAEEYIFTRKDTGEEIIPLRGFWFAWSAFNPDTIVFNR